MKTIQIHRHQTPAAGGATQVRANPAAFNTGSEAIGQSYGAIGAALASIGQVGARIADAERNSELAAKASEAELLWANTREQIAAEPDADKHNEIYEGYLEQTKTLGEKFKGQYARKWTEYVDNRKSQWQLTFAGLNRSRRLANAKSNYRTALEAAIETGELDAAIATIESMDELGILAPGANGAQGEKDALIAAAKKRVSLRAIENHIAAAPQEAKNELSASDWKDRYPHITSDDRNRLLQDATIAHRREKQVVREAQIELEHKSQTELYELHLDGKLTQQKLYEYFTAGKITTNQHQAFERGLKQAVQLEDAQTALQANEELYAMHIEGQLTEQVLNEWFFTGKIDSKLHASYIKTINAQPPNLGDKNVYFAAKQAIRAFRDGEIDYETVNDFIGEHYDKLTIAQFSGLFNDLDGTRERLGKDDTVTKAKLDWGEERIYELFENRDAPSRKYKDGEIRGGILGEQGSLAETNRAAELLSKWAELVRAGASQEQLDEFMQAAAMDVWDEGGWRRDAGINSEALNESNRRIMELMIDVFGE